MSSPSRDAARRTGGRSKVARLQHITELVRINGYVTVDSLADTLEVSRMTVHRDLDELQTARVLRKIHGGASVEPSTSFESDVTYRTDALLAEKRAIGAAAARLASDGDVAIVSDSTTTAQVIPHLRRLENITVVSNFLPVIEEVSRGSDLGLISLGGIFRHEYGAFLGVLCEQALADLYADILFVSSSAVLGTDVFHQDESVVKAKRAMMAASRRRVLMLDHTKFGRGALHRVGAIAEFTDVIVDEGCPPHIVESIRDLGVDLIVAPTEPLPGS